LYCNITRRLGYGLPRELWVVEAGVFLNYLGWGAVLPFEVIYLHEGRGSPSAWRGSSSGRSRSPRWRRRRSSGR